MSWFVKFKGQGLNKGILTYHNPMGHDLLSLSKPFHGGM